MPGVIEVIAGPMFAGKTEELIRRVRRAAIARRPIQVFTHAADTRNRSDAISSHTGLQFPSYAIASAAELESLVRADTEIVAVDEAQFFGPDLIPTAERLALRGVDVLIAALDVTFTGEPFEPVPALMALAERVDKLTAVCAACGEDAVYHQRIAASSHGAHEVAAEHIGGLDKYEARCRRHFTPGR
jgi:thymidine kinase